MRRRCNHRRRKNNSVRNIIIVCSVMTFLLATGYGAFQTNLNITAKGTIESSSNSYVSSLGDDETGKGTKKRPFRTIKKAYDTALSGETIYIMDDLTQTETTTFDQDKEVTLTSYNEASENNSIIRNAELTKAILSVTKGTLNLENIIIDGNNVEADEALVTESSAGSSVKTIININKGTLIKNGRNVTTDDYFAGGALNIDSNSTIIMNDGEISGNYSQWSAVRSSSKFILNGGKITNNSGESGGAFNGMIEMNGGEVSNNIAAQGGAMILGGDITSEINGGKIINNKAQTGAGGGIIAYRGIIEMNGGEISNNITANHGGGVYIWWGTGTFILNGGLIKNNTATSLDGGIKNDGQYTYKKGIICGNTPSNSYETHATCPSQ